mgnify:CR=1 FL=1
MNKVVGQMLERYEIHNTEDEINALKEVIQEIVLSGLSRGGFFEKAAFYGGTALRIFYNLDRFSEDLDFALLSPDANFDLSKYFNYIEEELKAYGLNMSVSSKEKSKETSITSAFIKGDTLEHVLKFFPNEENYTYDSILKMIKIKFEVDINAPFGATYEEKIKLLPFTHQILLYDKSSLFAGKVHAILCRNWKTRTKGRDLYDYVFFLANDIRVNFELLKNKLIASGVIKKGEKFDIDALRGMLTNKFKDINYAEAKNDVLPFIKDAYKLDSWNEDFFIKLTQNLNFMNMQ